MIKGKRRKSSDKPPKEPKKRQLSKRQKEKLTTQQGNVPSNSYLPPSSNYYQSNEYLYPPQIYDQQRSPRNMVYAPSVSIPSASGQYGPPSISAYPPVPPPSISTNHYPQYQPGLLAPPQSNMDPNRLSPRSNANSPIGQQQLQPSIKIPQVQPPNYPYPSMLSYPNMYSGNQQMYQPQWQQRFG
jgi:hypothetical protein